MKNVKRTTTQKLLSVILSAVMVLSTIPFSAISAFSEGLPEIEGIDVVPANDLVYTGEEQELVTVSGTQEGDTILYSTTGEDETWGEKALTGTDANNYTVFVKVMREGYESWISTPINVVIQKATMTGVSVESAGDLEYNGEEQELAVKVNGVPEDSTFQYRLESDSEFSPNFPKGKDAGDYDVYVNIDCANYKVDPVCGRVTIAKAENNATLTFKQEQENISVNNKEFPKTVDMSVTVGNAPAEGKVKYSVECEEGDAIIASDGQLTVNETGSYTVHAVLNCGANYKEVEKTFTLGVNASLDEGEHFYYFFNENHEQVSSVSFYLGETIPTVKLEKSGNKMPTVNYSIGNDAFSVGNDAFSVGKDNVVSYDMNKLADKMKRSGKTSLTVTVTASSGIEKGFDSEDSVSCAFTVSFLPDVTYTVSPSNEPKDKESGWYTSDVTLKAEGYQIAKADSFVFQDEITISENSTLWMCNKVTGAITAPFDFNVIDTEAPSEISVEASCEPYAVKADSHYVFLEEVCFTIRATDATSQPKHVEWTYVPKNATENATEKADFSTDEKGYYTTISLGTDVDVCSEVKFCVVDNAGNKTDEFTVVYNENDENEPYAAKDDGELKVFVVDKVSPTVTVNYILTDENGGNVYASENEGKYYFDDPEKVSVTFEVEEEFFFEEDFKLTVTNNDDPEKPVELEKDTDYTLTWSEDEETGKHIGTLKLNKDACQNGAYTFTAEYKDPSENPADFEDEESKVNSTYTSPYLLVVDKTAPKVEVKYKKSPAALSEEQTATITVTERNFDKTKVTYAVTAKDKSGNPVAQNVEYSDWESLGDDKYKMTVTFKGDANYSFNVSCEDRAGNVFNNEFKKRNPDSFIVDKTAPVIQSVTYSKSLRNEDLFGILFGYYKDQVKVTVVAYDATSGVNSFDYSYILADGVSGVNAGIESKAAKTITYSPDGKTATMEFFVPEEALTANNQFNGTVNITAVDLSGNSSEKKDSYRLVVDNLAPKATVTFNKPVATVGGVDYYNGAIKGTITITEANFDSKGVEVVVSKNGTNQTAAVSWTDKDVDTHVGTHVGTFTLSDDADYVVGVRYTDKSDNEMTPYLSGKMTVDTTKPKATVTFNDAVNTTGGVAYYNGTLKGTITVTDANFDAKSIKVVATQNGAAQTPAVSWTDTNRNLHVGTFTLSADADYVIDITGTDKATNAMAPYKSGKMTVDTEIENPTFTINGKACKGESGAYNGDVTVGYSFFDQNFSGKEIELIRYRFDEKKVVTEDFVQVTLNDKGGVGSFDIPKTMDNDGIYVLKVTMTDKAGHIAGDKDGDNLVFTVNRFGSVYQYDDYLCALIANGGQYRETIDQDLVVTEYNASEQAVGSLKIMITRDGESIEVIDLPKNPKPIKENSWYKYTYVISKANFTKDGAYKITISSKDVNGNDSTSVPDDPAKKIKGNSVDANGDPILDVMTFTVDNTDPEIRNIANLEKAIVDKSLIKDGKLEVPYSIVDAGGLAKIEIYINEDLVDTIDTFENINAYDGSFFINESNDIQKVRLVVTDLAGNIKDTDKDFDPGDLFVFNNEVTVSTDFFVRFYRNAPLFWGSIGGVAAVAAGIILLIAKKKNKKDDKKA